MRAESAAPGIPRPAFATGEEEKLRRQLVEAQWRYAEQADANVKALEAELKMMRAEVETARQGKTTLSPGEDAEGRRKEAEWTQEMNGWTRTQAAWTVKRRRLEGPQRDMRTQTAALQDERDVLLGEAECV